MPRILNLRKKNTPTLQILQKPEEKIEIKRKNIKAANPELAVHKGPIAEEKPHISWEAPSFYYNPQKRYLSMLILGLLVGAIALMAFNYDSLTSIFLILSSLVLILYANQKPTISKITVNQSGVWIDNIIYHYKDLRSFWIEYNPRGAKELSIESARWYLPYIKILLNNQNPIELRSLIINFLPEKEHENSLIDYISRKLGL